MEWNEMKQTDIAWQLNGLLSNRNHGRTQHENRYKDKNHNSYVRFSFIIKSTKKNTHKQYSMEMARKETQLFQCITFKFIQKIRSFSVCIGNNIAF